jgi:PKHD-type hydroxylase
MSTKLMNNRSWYLNNEIQEPWAYAEGLFTPEECNKIIQEYKNDLEQGTVSNDELLSKTRASLINFINSASPTTQWIFRRCGAGIHDLNNKFFNFDIEKIEVLQFSEYDESYKGFYAQHVDTGYQVNGFRKLSFSILLSDPNTYEGGDLNFYFQKDPQPAIKTQGTMIMFPSYTLHEVTPVTKGTRYALVGWVWGPRFK